jgi:hypothetical protein
LRRHHTGRESRMFPSRPPRAGTTHQQYHRDAAAAQAGGADRIFHQDRPRYPRREPDLLGCAAGPRSRHRTGRACG